MDLPTERSAPCINGECGFKEEFFSEAQRKNNDPMDCWGMLYFINKADPSFGYEQCPLAYYKAQDVLANAETDGELDKRLET